MAEMDDFDLELPGETESPKEEDGESKMTDDELGLSLKRAIEKGNGSAICEMIRKIQESY